MPANRYIPRESANPTVFPVAIGGDLSVTLRQLEEVWRRFYPTVLYRRRLVMDTPVVEGEQAFKRDVTSVGTGGSVVDPLWGETIPQPAPRFKSKWAQPQSSVESSLRDADNHHVFGPPQKIHVYIRRELNDYMLKRFGIEKIEDLIVIFLTSELDAAGIVVQEQDRFQWNNAEYEILNPKDVERWAHTDIFLFVVANCKRVRYGS